MLIVAGTTIGAGMLALPIASAGLGFTTALSLILLTWVLMTYTALLMLELHQYADRDATLNTLAKSWLGKRGQWVANFSVMFLFYALCAAYIAGGGAQLQEKLNNGLSLIDDLHIWIEKFNKFLIDSKLSKNTLVSYSYVLKALIEYSDRYLRDKEKLSDLSLYEVNNFLLWMENYQINRDYGSLKERTQVLIDFISLGAKNPEKDFIELREFYFILSDINNRVDINYVLDSFEEYYDKKPIAFHKIDNKYIKNYIASSEKKHSIATMAHRRAVLYKFIKFINDKNSGDVFDYVLKNMKAYKLPKGVIYKSKSLKKEVVDKIIDFINSYIADPSIFIAKPSKYSKRVAYKNTAMILLMMGAGCRVSEAISLRFKDITETEDTYKIDILSGKGNKHRTTYIRKELFKEHYEYLLSHAKDTDEYLSLTVRGDKMKRENLFNFTKKMFAFIGEDKQGLHIFRHHFGSNFAETNGNMKILQDLLGHSVITTTMIYSGVEESAKEVAVANSY